MKKAFFIIIWIALWALAAYIVGQQVLLAGPVDVCKTFILSLGTTDFWLRVWGSFWHIALGTIIACVLGCCLAVLSWKWTWVEDFLQPFIQFIKSAPVVCFVVILLVWFGSTFVDLIVVTLAVIPLYYFSTIQALKGRDAKLVEMLQVFQVSPSIRWRVFEWPTIKPYFEQATKTAVGMSWKSGITAQLIGITFSSIGEGIYLSKLSLDSAQLLMWTFVVVLLAWACEKLILLLIDQIKFKGSPAASQHALPPQEPQELQTISFKDVSFGYENKSILSHYSRDFMPGERCAFIQETGFGKSSFLGLMLGLKQASGGTVSSQNHAGVVFQETRLLPQLSAVNNVALLSGCDEERAKQFLLELLPQECLEALPSQLSGGQQRCVEICRALAAPFGLLVLDEPFTGLDDEAKANAVAFVEKHAQNRSLFVATHDKEDAVQLNCSLVTF